MHKQDFISELKAKLSGLPAKEVVERLNFYSEMIDDRMEEGIPEENAVAAIGSVDAVATQIIADIPLTKIAKERMKPQKRLSAWEIVLLVLGSPVWVSLLIAAFAVVFSVYVSLWSVIVSLWATFAVLMVCVLTCVAMGIVSLCRSDSVFGIFAIGAGFVCAGLGIFLFFGCKAVTKGILLLTKKIALGIKTCFVKKEEA